MRINPSKEDLRGALTAAGAAHHEFEQNFLKGVRDEQWPGWYAAYVLGSLGDFASPSMFTEWLESAPGGEDWSSSAAAHVAEQLRAV